MSSHVTLTGFLGDPEGMRGTIQLEARGGSIADVHVTGGVLQRTPYTNDAGIPPSYILASQIHLAGSGFLPLGKRETFGLAVSGVTVPGVYNGTIVLSAGSGSAVSVPATVDARIHPTVTIISPGTDIYLSVTHCTVLPADCALAHLLLPPASLQSSFPITILNPQQVPVRVLSQTVSLVGSENGPPPANAVRLQGLPNTIAPRRVLAVHLVYNRAQLLPGHYSGIITIQLLGGRGPRIVPLNIYVRQGPLLPLLVLFLSTILGFLLVLSRTGGRARLRALSELASEAVRLANLQDPEGATLLRMLARVLGGVVHGQTVNVRRTIDMLEGYRAALLTLRSLEIQLRGINTTWSKQLIPTVADVRQLLLASDGTSREGAYQRILQVRNTLVRHGALEEGNPALEGATATANSILLALDGIGPAARPGEIPGRTAAQASSLAGDTAPDLVSPVAAPRAVSDGIKNGAPSYPRGAAIPMRRVPARWVNPGSPAGTATPAGNPAPGGVAFPFRPAPKGGAERKRAAAAAGVAEGQQRGDQRLPDALPAMRRLFQAIILIALALLGMKILYLDAGRTFGANPFDDYIGLILWGLGSGIATQVLTRRVLFRDVL